MATIEHGALRQIGSSPEVSWICLWETLTSANAVGDSLEMTAWSDRSVQFVGTFDSATVVLQGSNDGTTWVTLTDPQGNAISKTAAGLEAISELTRYVRPSTSGGGGSQDIDVYLLVSGYRRW
jgi:hypothetical protein